jgi:hypothetical protein
VYLFKTLGDKAQMISRVTRLHVRILALRERAADPVDKTAAREHAACLDVY